MARLRVFAGMSGRLKYMADAGPYLGCNRVEVNKNNKINPSTFGSDGWEGAIQVGTPLSWLFIFVLNDTAKI